MARALNRLTAVKVKSAPAGKYADGAGLWAVKSERDTGKWVLRIVVHGRRREMGLGGIWDVSLAEAREEAAKWRAVARAGLDPIKERERQKREKERNLHLLSDVADIRDVLKPLRDTKAETMRKALNRLNMVVMHAAALGLNVDTQVVDKAKALIGASQHKPEHIPAMHWRDVPAFYATLDDGSVTHLALRLLILTGLRSTPVRHLHVDYIDADVLTVPAALMKSLKSKAKDFRVPLVPDALSVIEQAKCHAREGFLFPSARKGVISDATMSRLMERRSLAARPHGFRSSLRNWLAERTSAPHEVAEMILGHKTDSAVVRAYRRTDYLEERFRLMERWGRYVTTGRDESVSEFGEPAVVLLQAGASA